MNFDPNVDYYKILGAEPNFSKPQIIAQYNRIRSKTAIVEEAYRVLMDDTLKLAYDKQRIGVPEMDTVDEITTTAEAETEPVEEQEEAPVEPVGSTRKPSDKPITVRGIATCLVVLVLLFGYCSVFARFGLGGSIISTVAYLLIPAVIIVLYSFLKKGANKKRTAIIVGAVLAGAIAVVLGLQTILSPVIRGPQDIINSIGNSAGNVLTIQKTLAVSGDAHALDVPPTATNQSLDGNSLCESIQGLIHHSKTEVWIDPVPDWIGSASFNILVYWKVDGQSIKLNPNKTKRVSEEFRSVNTVTLDYIDTVQNGQSARYECGN